MRGTRRRRRGPASGRSLAVGRRRHRVAFASAPTTFSSATPTSATDVFVADRLGRAAAATGAGQLAAEPAAEVLEDPVPVTRRLRVFVRRAKAGKVRLDVRAPVRGKLTLAVRGRLPDADGRPLWCAAPTCLCQAHAQVPPGCVLITLKLAERYRGALRRNRALQARAAVRLVPRSGSPLAREVGVRFAYRAPSQLLTGV